MLSLERQDLIKDILGNKSAWKVADIKPSRTPSILLPRKRSAKVLANYCEVSGLCSGDIENGDLLFGKSLNMKVGNLFITNETF